MKRTRNIVWILIGITVLFAIGLYLLAGPHAFSGPFVHPKSQAVRLSIKAYERNEKANVQLIETWLDYQLFTWKWWCNVWLTVIPWLIWFRIRRKPSTHRLLYVGFAFFIMASYLDFFGVTYGFWRYHIEVVPTIPSYLPWDFTMYPVAGMLFVQYAPRLSPYLKGLLFACTAALVVEPLFILLQFYEPVQWNVFYSVPIHFITYLVGHWFSTRMSFAPLDGQIPPWQPPAAKP